MPNLTLPGWLQRSTALLGAEQGRTDAQSAEELGTYLRNLGLDGPAGLAPWEGDSYMIAVNGSESKEVKIEKPISDEERLKHFHNPRGLGLPTRPLSPYWEKQFKIKPGVVIFTLGANQIASKLSHNDESSLYLETAYGSCFYICSCFHCQKVCSVPGVAALASAERDVNVRYPFYSYEGRQRVYRRRYFGHAGALRYALVMGFRDGRWPDGSPVLAHHLDPIRAIPGMVTITEGHSRGTPLPSDEEIEYRVPSFNYYEEREWHTYRWYRCVL